MKKIKYKPLKKWTRQREWEKLHKEIGFGIIRLTVSDETAGCDVNTRKGRIIFDQLQDEVVKSLRDIKKRIMFNDFKLTRMSKPIRHNGKVKIRRW